MFDFSPIILAQLSRDISYKNKKNNKNIFINNIIKIFIKIKNKFNSYKY